MGKRGDEMVGSTFNPIKVLFLRESCGAPFYIGHQLSILSRFYFYPINSPQNSCHQMLSILSRFYFYIYVEISILFLPWSFNPIKVLFLQKMHRKKAKPVFHAFNPIKVLFLRISTLSFDWEINHFQSYQGSIFTI